MKTIYITQRFVKTGKYTGVYQTTQGFARKEHADMYKEAHNAQYPHDQLHVDELTIVDENESFQPELFSFETFEYMEIRFTFAEDRLEKTEQGVFPGNSIDQTSEVLSKANYSGTSRYSIPFLPVVKPEDTKNQRIHEITLSQRIHPLLSKEEMVEQMKTRAHHLVKRAIEFGRLGDFTPYSVEDFLNDETLTKTAILEQFFKVAKDA